MLMKNNEKMFGRKLLVGLFSGQTRCFNRSPLLLPTSFIATLTQSIGYIFCDHYTLLSLKYPAPYETRSTRALHCTNH
ncbi:hypothetical protein PanWU01x14_347650 [Parasponia andersonii]|uniref:Uncharacterized protein n=1 Tax=Parasponia andersonii TaxID=3476 RepID=A0A2P5ABV7_PARAD|nr:hypothetical protein PanWU01x14_347650 [Parasponia andersonii]